MANKVDAALQKLASLSQTLNEISDQLSKQIAEIESELSEYRLGVTAWVEVKREQDLTQHDEDGEQYALMYVEQLGYGKHNGKWGLLSSWFFEETGSDPDNISFLRDASREIRLAAVEKFPDLLEALGREAAKLAEKTTKRVEEAKEIATALKYANL